MLKPSFAAMVCAAIGLVQSSNSASASGLLWARTGLGGYVSSAAVDESGHCYVGGLGTHGFLYKYDTAGTLLWTRQYGGSRHEGIHDVTLDQAGNVLIAGSFVGTVDFGTTNITAVQEDMFLAKISNEGDCIWVVKGGGEYNDFA